MRDTWGPPRDGWPIFDDEGKRVDVDPDRNVRHVPDEWIDEIRSIRSIERDPETGAIIPTQPRGMGKRRIETVPLNEKINSFELSDEARTWGGYMPPDFPAEEFHDLNALGS